MRKVQATGRKSEPEICNQGVTGSSPVAGTSNINNLRRKSHGDASQELRLGSIWEAACEKIATSAAEVTKRERRWPSRPKVDTFPRRRAMARLRNRVLSESDMARRRGTVPLAAGR